MSQLQELFKTLGGQAGPRHGSTQAFPIVDAPVRMSPDGIAYLSDPGVVMLAQPNVCAEGLRGFLGGFDPELRFAEYLDDSFIGVADGPALAKIAGQLCYLSFGPNRSMNEKIGQYLDHIKESGHGSVLEHASYSFLLYGVSRSLTHELVRHRVGIAYSQVSQRYVDGKKLRFIMRPETPECHDEAGFFRWIRLATEEYDRRAKHLSEHMQSDPAFAALPPTERRKRVNQAARACLPNETEAPIIVSVNARTLRHLAEMRVSNAAEIEIRRAFFRVFLCMVQLAPEFFNDYEVTTLSDGTHTVTTPYRRV